MIQRLVQIPFLELTRVVEISYLAKKWRITMSNETNYPVVDSSPMSDDELRNLITQASTKHSNSETTSVIGNNISSVETDGGDFVLGTKSTIVVVGPNRNKITEIIELSKSYAEESDDYRELVEELESYQKPRPNREIVGLENKLRLASMEELLEDAFYLKDKTARRLARHQFSSQKMAVHIYLFGKIREQFNSNILPIIKNGLSPDEVNQVISNVIVSPISEEVAPADPSINADIVRGMLYFLTGNCHIKWN